MDHIAIEANEMLISLEKLIVHAVLHGEEDILPLLRLAYRSLENVHDAADKASVS